MTSSRRSRRAPCLSAAQEDPLTGPLEAHKEVFAKAGKNAEFKVLTPHHLATYFDDAFERSIGVQIEFLTRTLLKA